VRHAKEQADRVNLIANCRKSTKQPKEGVQVDEQLNLYCKLLAELLKHHDERFECIVPFSPRSNELLNFMWDNDHRDENEAFADLAGLLNERASELTAASKDAVA
jgi:hypothetical protein